jgi:hypothetical protein
LILPLKTVVATYLYQKFNDVLIMKKLQILLAAWGCLFLLPVELSAQYPQVPKDIQAASDSMMKAEQRMSDIAWGKALPIIQKEAKEGKPYIPWAARPYDLPQADIPAFPGRHGRWQILVWWSWR